MSEHDSTPVSSEVISACSHRLIKLRKMMENQHIDALLVGFDRARLPATLIGCPLGSRPVELARAGPSRSGSESVISRFGWANQATAPTAPRWLQQPAISAQGKPYPKEISILRSEASWRCRS